MNAQRTSAEETERTLAEEHPLNGGKETVWRLDESDYGPEGSHPVIQGELDI